MSHTDAKRPSDDGGDAFREEDRFANELEERFDELVQLMRRYPVEVEWKGPPYLRYVFDCEDDIRNAINELRAA